MEADLRWSFHRLVRPERDKLSGFDLLDRVVPRASPDHLNEARTPALARTPTESAVPPEMPALS